MQNKTKTIILNTADFDLNYQDIYDNFIGIDEKSKFNIDGNYTYETATTNYIDDTLIVYKTLIGKKVEVARFVRTNTSGYRHRTVLCYKHYIISGGSYGYVFIYDAKSKSRMAKLIGVKDYILDLALNGDVLTGLDERGDIRLYNLSEIKPKIAPYLTVTLYNDDTFLLRSGGYFYTNDINKAVCLKPTKLSLIKTSCIPSKDIVKNIILSKKPLEKKVKIINLTSDIPIEMDVNINRIFNTSKYVILGDVKYYALNKETKKLKEIKLPRRNIMSILEKDGFIYILLRWGNIYKFDKNLNFIAKTNFEPNISAKTSRYLSVYKKYYIASRYKDKIWIFDKNLNPKYKVSVPIKKLSYWTFIDDILYLDINDKLYKIDLKTKKHKSIGVDIVKLKTNQNKFVVNIDKYYLLDKDFHKKPLELNGRFYDFYNGKKYFYALSNNEIVKFLDGKKIESARITENIDSLAGAAEIGDKVVFVTQHKLKTYDFKTKEIKLLTQPSIRFFELYIDGDYEVAKSDNYIYVYKNLKLIKRIKNDDFIYNVNNKIYLKAYSGIKYAIDLKTFKIIDVTKIPETQKTPAYYSGTDGYIYYKSFATKAKERIFKVYETNKYIVAWGVDNNLYVYDKKLNLLKKIVLDKRVNALDITGDGWLYYAIYDNVFRYKIK